MKRVTIAVLIVLTVFTGCGRSSATTKEWFAMDTVMRATAYTQDESLLSQSEQQVRRLEQLFSVTDPQSEIALLNGAQGEWVTVSPDTARLLADAKTYAAQTEGRFDPTVYPAVTAWGFTEETKRVPSQDELQRLTEQIDFQKIQIDGNRVRLPKEMGVDFGGIAKGYAADRLKELWESAGVSGVIALGGNVVTVGQKPSQEPFAIGVQDPYDASATLGTLSLQGGQVAVTSGSYQRNFEQNGVTYHHILDPDTAAPAQSDLISVTVVGDCAAAADAYATALFVAGAQQGLALAKKQNLQALFVTCRNEIVYTDAIAFTPVGKGYTVVKAGE